MIHVLKPITFISVFGVLCLIVLASCAQRHTNIPRQFTFNQKNKSTWSHNSGHYVKESVQNAVSPTSVIVKHSSRDTVEIKHQTKLLLSDAVKPKQLKPSAFHRPLTRIKSDTIPAQDSLTVYQPEKSKKNGAIGLFTLVAGLNVAYLVAPGVGFMVMGLLIGLGLLVIGFFLSRFISDARKNRIIPEKIRTKGNYSRANNKLRRAFKALMASSAISLTLALISVGLNFWELSFGLAVIGMVLLYAGLLVGLIYLATSF